MRVLWDTSKSDSDGSLRKQKFYYRRNKNNSTYFRLRNHKLCQKCSCEHLFSFEQNLRRQIRKAQYKFHMADADKNGKMNRDEYVDFEHPEENKKMEEIALDEVIEDVDQNGDG